MMNRPILIPGLPRAWRRPGELQLGCDPARALVLQMADPRTASVLDLLDGSRSERQILIDAAELGISAEDCGVLLRTLHTAGLAMPAVSLLPRLTPPAVRARLIGEAAALALADAAGTSPSRSSPPSPSSSSPPPSRSSPSPPPSRSSPSSPSRPSPSPAQRLRCRQRARVVICGRGRLGAGIAVALAEAGVGQVRPELPGLVGPDELAGGPLRGTDVNRPRRDAVIEAMARAAPATASGVRREAATLVVQLDPDQPVSLLAAAHAARRQPHLAVTIREGAAMIGPLVSAAGAPCLHCLELHRRDRDAHWPGPPVRHAGAEPATVTTLLAATAYAAAEVLTFLDGGHPETTGASVEISSPGRVRRRTWPPHPACPCGATPQRARQNK
jgi:bacteriocin biosynthesis cyclodehydratase domain-containing protein